MIGGGEYALKSSKTNLNQNMYIVHKKNRDERIRFVMTTLYDSDRAYYYIIYTGHHCRKYIVTKMIQIVQQNVV